MMRISIFSAAAAAILLFGIVRAEDYNPPDWRGQDNTTVQLWEFGDDNPTPPPDYVSNPFGSPSLEVTGSAPWTIWLASDHGHTGVWKFEDYIQVDIPNLDQQNAYKEIWLQLIMSAERLNETNPVISAIPGAGPLELIDKQQIDDYYWRATYSLTIEPNPASETIYIQPRDCTLYLDELVIDTICVPEPATIMLMGLAAIALLRKRTGP